MKVLPIAALLPFLVMAFPALASDDRTPVVEPNLRVEKPAELFEVESSIWVGYPAPKVWDVVLDYDGLSRYMNNVDSSYVVRRPSENTVIVRQVGSVRAVFKKTFRMVLEFERLSSERMAFRQLSGDFRDYSGEWRVRSEGVGARIVYRASLRQGAGIPDFLADIVIKKNAKKMMPAIADELKRRWGPPLEAGSSRGSVPARGKTP